jgi:hypothetical protein
MPEQLSPDEMQALADAIAERIVRDPSLADSLTSQLAASLVCPPKKLCCFLGYNCDTPFTCQRDFRCPQGYANQAILF